MAGPVQAVCRSEKESSWPFPQKKVTVRFDKLSYNPFLGRNAKPFGTNPEVNEEFYHPQTTPRHSLRNIPSRAVAVYPRTPFGELRFGV